VREDHFAGAVGIVDDVREYLVQMGSLVTDRGDFDDSAPPVILGIDLGYGDVVLPAHPFDVTPEDATLLLQAIARGKPQFQ